MALKNAREMIKYDVEFAVHEPVTERDLVGVEPLAFVAKQECLNAMHCDIKKAEKRWTTAVLWRTCEISAHL